MKRQILSILFCLCITANGFTQTITNVGTDFWIAFPPNGVPGISLKLFISSNYSTSGSVSSAFPGVDQTFTVAPGIVTQVIIPVGIQLTNGTEDKGIHVTSNDPISLYGLNCGDASADAFLALPVNALGLDYRIMTYSTTFSSAAGSDFSIVATQSGTNLTIYNHQLNSTSTVELLIGQTYHVKSTNMGDDLTGSRIQSNIPVAVFGSAPLVLIPAGCNAGDHITEQMFPYYSWGKNFVTVSLAGRDASGDIFRVLAAEDATIISINGSAVATINSGDYYETNLSGNNGITTSKATMLAQFAKGEHCSGMITGDPMMMLIPPREQFLTNYTISTVDDFSSWVNLVVPDYAIGTIYQDGVLIPTSAFSPVPSTTYFGAQKQIAPGSHTFTSLSPFGLFVYGWRQTDSYGYPGGCSLSQIGTVSSVTISPPNATGVLNVSNLCFTAHVENNLSNPIAGVLVNFNISGISNITGTAYTDALGNAQYCYARTGSISGIDNIYAECFGNSSTISIANWIPSCANPTSSGTIGSNQTICSGLAPLPLNSISLPSGQSGSLEYKWQNSTTGPVSGFTDITGSNSTSYAPDILFQTTWYRRVARVDCMPDWTGAIMTDAVEITVNNPVFVDVTINADRIVVCSGENVFFTATPVNGGTAPSYQWKVNAVITGSNTPVFTYVPVNGDQVQCLLTSSVTECISNNPASSNTVTMVVNTSLPAGITIAASSNPFCPGSPVTFTATPFNGGSNPSYQWKMNGLNAGTNASSFSYNPTNNDSVRCIINSNLTCVTGNPASSARITMIGSPAPNIVFTPCFDTVTRLNAKPYKLRGGLPLGGSYSGPGVNSSTGMFTPSVAGIGVKTINYSYVNVYDCSANKSKSILVQPAQVFSCGSNLTDTRDNKVYQTVQIGTQCWMAENLNYGNTISSSQGQYDNCISEKYCYNNLTANCNQYGGLYQWDELMNYTDTPLGQGLCPPGWHVPSESDWTMLFNYYQDNSRAGRPLQDTIINGFKALRSGVYYLNSSMSFFDFATLFWSSTSTGQSRALAHGLNSYNFSVSLYQSSRANAFPIRCLKD